MNTTTLSKNLNRQIEIAEQHLARFEAKHGRNSDYHKRAQALEATRQLHKGLCGQEEPVFKKAGTRRG